MPTPTDDNPRETPSQLAPHNASDSHGAKSESTFAPDAPSSQDDAEKPAPSQPDAYSEAASEATAVSSEPGFDGAPAAQEGFSADPVSDGEKSAETDDPADETWEAAAHKTASEADGESGSQESSAASKLKAAAGSAVDSARKAAGALGQETASGFSAFKAVNQAKRAHTQARERLDELKNAIERRTQELSHRQDVEARYDEILQENSQVIQDSLASIAQLESEQGACQDQVAQLQEAFEQLKAKNAKDLKPYEKLARNAKSSAEDANRALSAAKRDFKGAQNTLRDLISRRDSRVNSTRKAVDNSRQRLNRLQGDLADLQRDDEATPQQVADLRAEITAEMARLSKAQEDAQVAPNENSASINAAERQVDEAQRRLDSAQASADSAKRESKKQSRTLEELSDQAKASEQAAEDQVIEAQKHLKKVTSQLAQAQETKETAEAAIAEAHDIHHTPEKTQELLEQLDDDNAAAALQQSQVDSLAADEQDLRRRTRTSRIAFILVVVAAIIVLIVLFMVLFGPKGA